MLEYIEEATNLLGSVWGEAKSADVRTYLKKYLSHWSAEEQEDLLTLCAALANYEAEAAASAERAAARECRGLHEAARKTSQGLRKFKLRESDKRETARREAIIDRHFGAILRGETSTDDQGEAP